MKQREAVALIAGAVEGSGSVWADLGAGTGTFTRALRSLLRSDARIYAVDTDATAISELRGIDPAIIPVIADFTSVENVPAGLDGILLANSLHFVRDARGVLRGLVERLASGGRVVIVEYDRRAASRWVPYPVDSSQWPQLAEAAGLRNARITARQPSVYAGDLYAGVAERAQNA